MITRNFGIPVTSPGAILRRERDLGTPLGQETAEVLQSGGLVSDKIIIELIEDWLRLHGGHGFVFDGFPRTRPQAESLNSILKRLRTALDLVIWLEVSEETVRDRIAGRLQCGECGFTTSSSSAQFANRPVCPYCDGPLVRRNDDDLSVLQTRLQEFHTKTEPLAAFYQKMSTLHWIDGNRVFPGNICISLNDEVVHGIGSQRRIQYGDIVKLDIGIIQDGWVGDNATTVPVGIIDERTDQLLRVTENALSRAIQVAREGRRVGDICAEIEDEARRFGFSVVREFVGHGV